MNFNHTSLFNLVGFLSFNDFKTFNRGEAKWLFFIKQNLYFDFNKELRLLNNKTYKFIDITNSGYEQIFRNIKKS